VTLISVRFSASTSSFIVSCEPLTLAGCTDVFSLSNVNGQVVALIIDKVGIIDVLSGILVISDVICSIAKLARLVEVADLLPISVVLFTFSELVRIIDLSVLSLSN